MPLRPGSTTTTLNADTPLSEANHRSADRHQPDGRVHLAFTEYATGKWTVAALADHLASLGLDLPATPTKPAKPITKGRLHTLLRHPYYRGVVTFQGVEYPGQHQALADPATWHKVQDILDSHRNGERQHIHNHHLKTTVVCGQCGSRLLVQNAKNGRGVVYPYFVCSRRHRKHDCAIRAVLIEQIETRMSDLYHHIHLTHEDRKAVERYLLAEFDRIETHKARDIRSLTMRRTNIEDKRRRYAPRPLRSRRAAWPAHRGTGRVHHRTDPDRAPAACLPGRHRRSPSAPHPGP